MALPLCAQAETSTLWGSSGESFEPTGRLMDWSYAGYRSGEAHLPSAAITLNVADYGAVPNDDGDDTSAFQAALAAVAEDGGVVFVPEGTFRIAEQLTLESGVVLRGAGPDKTTLDIVTSLTDLLGNSGLDGGGTSSYSFVGGFIEAHGGDSGSELTTVTQNASRGSNTVEVASATGLTVGQWIRIVQTDVGGNLMDRLHSDLMASGDDNVGDKGMDFHTRIKSVVGTTVELERFLPLDIDTAWTPRILAFSPSASEVGVEELSIQFPLTTYPGHFKEQGYNAIDFDSLAHSWVKNVWIFNADYGVNIRNSYFVTVSGVVLSTTGDRGAIAGHHGINNGHGSDNLFIDFDIRTTFQHDLTTEWYATGVVFTKGRGDNLRMDHHRAAPYSTLWTEIDCGAGTQAFTSGGASNRGPHTASYDTLWNVTADADMNLPPNDYGPRMNFIGFRTSATEVTSPYDWWMENIAPDALEPANLWQAQLELRVPEIEEPSSGGTGGTSAAAGGTDGAGGAEVSTGGAPVGAGGMAATTGGSAPQGDDGSSTDASGCSCRLSSKNRGSGGQLSAFLLLCWIAARRWRRKGEVSRSIG